MRYKVNPEYGAKITDEKVVIGHFKNFAIIEKEDGELFYIVDQNKNLEIGEYVSGNIFRPVSSLPKDTYEEIIEVFKKGDAIRG